LTQKEGISSSGGPCFKSGVIPDMEVDGLT